MWGSEPARGRASRFSAFGSPFGAWWRRRAFLCGTQGWNQRSGEKTAPEGASRTASRTKLPLRRRPDARRRISYGKAATTAPPAPFWRRRAHLVASRQKPLLRRPFLAECPVLAASASKTLAAAPIPRPKALFCAVLPSFSSESSVSPPAALITVAIRAHCVVPLPENSSFS